MWRAFTRVLTLVCLLCAGSFAAAQGVQINAAATQLDLFERAAYFVDYGGAVDANRARQLWRAGRFTAAAGRTSNLGFVPAPVWLALDLHSTADAPHDWLLVIDYPPLDRVEVYLAGPHDGGAASASPSPSPSHDAGRIGPPLEILGDHTPQAQRSLPGRVLATRLHLNPDAGYTLLLRVTTEGSANLPLQLWQAPHFVEHEARRHAFHSAYAGMLLTLLLLALVVYVRLRDPVYLLYGAYVTTFGLSPLIVHGMAGWYLWPDSTGWNHLSPPVMLTLSAGFGAQFVRHFFPLRARAPSLDTALRVLAWLAFLSAGAYAAGLIGYRALSMAVFPLGLLAFSLALAAGLRLWRSYPPARMFVLSWVPLLAGSATFTLQIFGQLPASFWTTHGVQLCSLLEVLLLAWALTGRMLLYRSQTEQAQAEALRLKDASLNTIKLHERELEQRVRERTVALSNANSLLEQREHELLQLARKDTLTRLANRRAFDERLTAELARARRDGSHCVLYLIDLDGFKQVNDSLGHPAGDTLLTQFAERLNDAVRASDLVARIGGDEFAVLASGQDHVEDAGVLAHKIVALAQQPFTLFQSGGEQSGEPKKARIGASVGYAVFPGDANEEAALLRHADQAMYQAKRAGKGIARRYEGADAPAPGTGQTAALVTAPAAPNRHRPQA